MNEIDRALAAHYNLSAEELDFVVNDDMNYRLGRAAGERLCMKTASTHIAL